MPYRNADLVVRSKTEHPLIAKPFDEALAEATRWWPLPLFVPRTLKQWTGLMAIPAALTIVAVCLFTLSAFKAVTTAFLITTLVYTGRGLIHGRVRTGAERLNTHFEAATINVVRNAIESIREKRAVHSVDLLVETKKRLDETRSKPSPSRQVDEARYARWIGPYNALHTIIGSLRSNQYRIYCGDGIFEDWGWAGIDGDSLSETCESPNGGSAETQIATVNRLLQQYISTVAANRQERKVVSSSYLNEERTIREELRAETAKLGELLEEAENALERFNAVCCGEETINAKVHTLNPPT